METKGRPGYHRVSTKGPRPEYTRASTQAGLEVHIGMGHAGPCHCCVSGSSARKLCSVMENIKCGLGCASGE